MATWPLFEVAFAQEKGSKENRTKWIVEVNELRKPVVHASKGQSLPITEEQLARLQEIRSWLETRVGSSQ
jgi:DNA sulfur modification protein DndB